MEKPSIDPTDRRSQKIRPVELLAESPTSAILVCDRELPDGVTFHTGVLTGKPTEPGSYPITLTASNGVAPSAEQSFTLIVAPFGITTESLPDGVVYTKSNKARYTARLTASGGKPPYKWSLIAGSGLPPGLKLDASGAINGEASTAGTYSFTVEAVDTKTKSKPPTQNTA